MRLRLKTAEIRSFAAEASPTRPPLCGQSLSGVYLLFVYIGCSTVNRKGKP